MRPCDRTARRWCRLRRRTGTRRSRRRAPLRPTRYVVPRRRLREPVAADLVQPEDVVLVVGRVPRAPGRGRPATASRGHRRRHPQVRARRSRARRVRRTYRRAALRRRPRPVFPKTANKSGARVQGSAISRSLGRHRDWVQDGVGLICTRSRRVSAPGTGTWRGCSRGGSAGHGLPPSHARASSAADGAGGHDRDAARRLHVLWCLVLDDFDRAERERKHVSTLRRGGTVRSRGWRSRSSAGRTRVMATPQVFEHAGVPIADRPTDAGYSVSLASESRLLGR